MKKSWFIGLVTILIILILIIIGLRLLSGDEDTWLCQNGAWVKHGKPNATPPLTGCGEVKAVTNFTECAALGLPVMETYPRQCRFEDKTFVEDLPVILDGLKANDSISSPLNLTGRALGSWFFEGSFPVKLIGQNNQVLAQSYVQAIDDWMQTGYVRFKGAIEFKVTTTTTGLLVFSKDNPSGLPQNDQTFSLPVTIVPNIVPQDLTVKIFFANTIKDSEMLDCQKVFAVERVIPYTVATAKAAITELLKGITAEEKTAGYFTNIPSATKLQKIEITDQGVAKADFSDQLDFQVGGSCRVANIRGQITQTLLQFPTIKSVVISINGRSEDILQP
ncbi:MAG: GerMN domain-containing protein [Candidatus Buchananbacteria bacterium]